jgi:hypothetical protein
MMEGASFCRHFQMARPIEKGALRPWEQFFCNVRFLREGNIITYLVKDVVRASPDVKIYLLQNNLVAAAASSSQQGRDSPNS